MALLLRSKAIPRGLAQTSSISAVRLGIPANRLRSSPCLCTYSTKRPSFQETLRGNNLAHNFHSTAMKMASTDLKQTLTPTLLQEVHELWFKHLNSEELFILPGWAEMGKWFARDEEFDKVCLTNFRPALETIIASGASAADIISAINPSSPMDWLNLIILLDQIPRNCYRGDESKVVFGIFDPLAEEIALQAFAQGIPTQSSYYRYRIAYRHWFHMPLMHSENLAVHEQAVKVHEDTAKDIEEFLARDPESLSEEEKPCYRVLSEKAEALKALLSDIEDYEIRHKVIIEKFGRYPHRNQPLGRESTPEEIEYLRNGGETFG